MNAMNFRAYKPIESCHISYFFSTFTRDNLLHLCESNTELFELQNILHGSNIFTQGFDGEKNHWASDNKTLKRKKAE